MKKYISFRLGKDTLSFLIDKKSAVVTLILLLLTFFVFIISTGVGEVFIGPVDSLQTILGFGDPMHELLIQSFRLPRIIIALLVGAALAVAGAILQNLVRNPLASPDVIGITGGASVAVILFLTLFSDSNHSLTVSLKWLPVAAFIGAMVTTFAIYFLAWQKGASSFRLVLIGIGISMLTQSLTTLFMIKAPIYQAAQANVWITGSIYDADWKQVHILVPTVMILLMITMIMVRNINLQEFGDQIATGMGSRVEINRFALLLLSAAFIASAVSFSGVIGFVGLMAPHMARRPGWLRFWSRPAHISITRRFTRNAGRFDRQDTVFAA